MQWNKNGEVLRKHLQGNFFMDNMSQERRKEFRLAFGLDQGHREVARYHRDDKGVPDKTKPIFYQEGAAVAKEKVWSTLDFYACRIGASLSQVVHAVTTNNRAALARSIEGNVERSIETRKYMDKDGIPREYQVVTLRQGYVYKGPHTQWGSDDFEKAVDSEWYAAVGVLSEDEQKREGRQAELHKFKDKQKGKTGKGYDTSKKDAMANVKVEQVSKQKVTA